MLVLLLFASGCGRDGRVELEPPAEWPATIVLGVVPDPDADDLAARLVPLTDALSSRLGIDVELVEAADHETLAADVAAGRTDFGVVEPLAFVDTGDLVAVSQLARFGTFTRHGAWFTSDDSVCADEAVGETALTNGPNGLEQVSALEADAQQVGVVYAADGAAFAATTATGDPISPGRSCIGDLDHVDGATVALITPGSLAGGVFPALQLDRIGIDPGQGIDARYTGAHDAAVRAVYDGDARFGVAFDDARRRLAEEHPDVGERVIVFHLTDEIPHEVIVSRPDRPPLLAASLQDALAAYLETVDGARLVDRTLGWTDVRTAVDADFDVVREAVAARAPGAERITTSPSPGSP